ncbi:mucin-12 [Contarinia nasturtii]|uniref:mucin-12 n=1 Tax=Contarinia nasturtii TaxID=265458 RepID=UPI0012D46103|nr:mucin-12 [Contarinia nasturtii]XP_031618762.1 mucin-12 [Contarinia nasturtii]XP_031618763.1 mucin-12 [Contarinia nasturtii]
MRTKLVLMIAIVSVWPNKAFSTLNEKNPATPLPQIESVTNDGDEYDSESARKIIGSRVVTSVSVVMNGKEPQFADAVGNYIPRPLVPPRVASPVSLLDPDRYEFYTFNDDGELVKRLMTMEEIQSIVANGDSEQQALAKNPAGNPILDNEASIRDIVNNVQKVLHSEMANNNFTASLSHNKLDTPDTSSSWSSILPAIFGNTGESIVAQKIPVTTGSTADSIIMQSTTTHKKPATHKPSTSISKTTVPPKTTPSKLTKQKPKPSRPASSSSVTATRPNTTVTQKTKPTSAAQTTQHIKNTQTNKVTYSQQSTSGTLKPTKAATAGKPSSSSLKPSTAYVQKIAQTTHRVTYPPSKTASTAADTTPTKKTTTSKRPVTQTKYASSSLKTSPSSASSSIQTTKLPLTIQFTPTKKINNKIPSDVGTNSPIVQHTYITTIPTKKKISPTTPSYKTTKIVTESYTPKENWASTVKYPSKPSVTTRRTVTSPIQPTTRSPPQTISSETIFEPEPDNVFDSELSLNQIIESLKGLEGTTMPYASNYMDFVDLTTLEPNSMPPLDRINTDSVTIMNNGQNLNSQTYAEKEDAEFKQSVNSVSYIPQTTFEYPDYSPTTITTTTNKMKNRTNSASQRPMTLIEHKESDDEMEMVLDMDDEKTTYATVGTTTTISYTTTPDSLSKQSTNSMDTMLRESFDSVLSQVQNEVMSTTIDFNDVETTTYPQIQQDVITIKSNDRKKVVVKPTPYISFEVLEGGGATESMKYFEAVIKHYEQEKNKNESINGTNSSIQADLTTQTTIDDMKTTEKPFEMDRVGTTTVDSDSLEMTTENFTEEEKSGIQTQETFKSSESSSYSEENLTTTEVATEEMPLNLLRTENDENFISNEESTQSITIEPEEMSTIQFIKDSTEKLKSVSITEKNNNDDVSTSLDADITTIGSTFDDDDSVTTTDGESFDQSTVSSDFNQEPDENQTQYEMIKLIENIMKNEKTNNNAQPNITNNLVERKEDANEMTNKKIDNGTTENYTTQRDEIEFSDLGETTTITSVNVVATEKHKYETKTKTQTKIKTKPESKPSPTSSVKSPLNKLKLPTLAPILNNLKMKVVNALKNTNTINLEPAPKQALGLEESTAHASEDILEFTKFCNEVAFNFWTALNNEGISSARSLTISPFALTSMLAMFFLGARGRTSGEINDMLHLDDIVTFNPHAMLRNISDSVEEKKDGFVYSNAFVRELLSERSKGKILPFFKEKVSQFYSGYVEEINFNTVNDVIRRRTNLLIKRYTGGKVNEYLKTSNVWVKPPLAGISANIFETDCSRASKVERDGEMFFQVLPAIRQRRLVPIPAVVWKSGFTAGYDPELDATAVAIGLSGDIISTIFVMPGQQGHSAPGDNLERLESVLMVNAVSQNAWRRLLATLMERPGLEVQIPRFTHRSFVNTTNALKKLGLETLFDQNLADLRGITGSIGRDVFVSDLIQINTFSTCGEDKLAEEHHVEMYPAPPNKHRNIDYTSTTSSSSSSAAAKPIAVDYENERAFASDPIYDSRYLSLPLPLRPRQARIPENPRLRFDKPFIYFVRHNPTGMVLYFGRFNPRLLP